MDEDRRFGVAEHLLMAKPYIPEWLDFDRSEYIRLDRNENTEPLPARVRVAIANALGGDAVQSYPQFSSILGPLSEYVGVGADWLLTTNGSDQGIDLCLRAVLSRGSSVLFAQPEFAVFSHVAAAIGASRIGVPYEEDLSFPYAAFGAAVAAAEPDLIVFINPNNPTGTGVDTDFIEQVASQNPDTLVLVDEAYYEYTRKTVVPLVSRMPNIVVLRTFSKAFAMAGLRLGYVVASPWFLEQLRKLQNPFDVNQLAVVAGIAQLERRDEVAAGAAHTMNVIKPHVVSALSNDGEKIVPGEANFVLIWPKDCAGAVKHLRDAGVLVRSMSAPALRGAFRVSIGLEHEMKVFLEAYRSSSGAGRT